LKVFASEELGNAEQQMHLGSCGWVVVLDGVLHNCATCIEITRGKICLSKEYPSKEYPSLALRLGIANLVGNFDGYRAMLDSGREVCEVDVAVTEAAQCEGFACSVARVAGKGRGLLVVLDDGADLPENLIAVPHRQSRRTSSR
jgi:hypothetical protein